VRLCIYVAPERSDKSGSLFSIPPLIRAVPRLAVPGRRNRDREPPSIFFFFFFVSRTPITPTTQRPLAMVETLANVALVDGVSPQTGVAQ